MLFHWVLKTADGGHTDRTKTKYFRFDAMIRGLVSNGHRPNYVTISWQEVIDCNVSVQEKEQILHRIMTALEDPRLTNIYISADKQ